MRHRRIISWSWVTLLLMAGLARLALGQSRYQPRFEEPRWFTFRLSQVSAGMYAEGLWNETAWEDSDITARYTRVFVGPSLGLFGVGSIYHPNLLTFNLTSDGAFGWSHERSESGGDSLSTEEWDYLGTVGVSLSFLSSKPYNGSAFANYDHTYRDNDFYSRMLVRSWRYGTRADWQISDPLSISMSYSHRDEESSSRYPARFVSPFDPSQGVVTDYEQTTELKEDTATFGAKHGRERGETSFDYIFSRYTRADFGQVGRGDDHSFNLADQETFGDREQYQLNSSLSYTLRDNDYEDSNDLLGNLSLSAEHRPNLRSSYDFSYSRFEVDDFKSDAYIGQVGLEHQLYESLTSGLLLRAADYETSDSVNEGYTRRFGAGISEDYTKRLTEEHRLRLGASVFVDHTDQQTLGSIVNERHLILASGEAGAPVAFSFFLNLPNVDLLSIVITDERNAPPVFVPGFDYAVSQIGTRTLITWLRPPGPGTPTTVLVDYEAEPNAQGDYETVTQNYYIRLELWKNLLGVYGRLNLSDNNAPADMRIQEFTTYTIGTDLAWQRIRAGAEYQVYDYSDSEYQVIRLFQSYGFRPDSYSSLNIDFNEMWIDYKDRDRREEDYRAMIRYYRTLTRRLGLTAEAGTAFRRGQGADQFLATFRPAIKYLVGRTSLDAGYFYQYERFLNQEERQKHMLTMRLRRVF